MAERLFVYGTLHPQRAPREIASLVRSFIPAGRGHVRGRLYDHGDYPALILDDTASPVPGEVFLIPAAPSSLAELDAYEEFFPGDPAASLFVRKKVPVTLTDGTQLPCWIYLYNQPLGGMRELPGLASVA
jgi:gamma-glutamylcyclotransferase (GGCT)/AIG2-like uncharacterized protein YtfP